MSLASNFLTICKTKNYQRDKTDMQIREENYRLNSPLSLYIQLSVESKAIASGPGVIVLTPGSSYLVQTGGPSEIDSHLQTHV